MFIGKTKDAYPKPDGKYTFDKLSSVFITGNATRDDAPNHIRVQKRVPREIAETWRWMCPAGVYEIPEDAPEHGDVDVIVNYTNCVQCGAITAKGGRLTTPEGGDGPLYQILSGAGGPARAARALLEAKPARGRRVSDCDEMPRPSRGLCGREDGRGRAVCRRARGHVRRDGEGRDDAGGRARMAPRGSQPPVTVAATLSAVRHRGRRGRTLGYVRGRNDRRPGNRAHADADRPAGAAARRSAFHTISAPGLGRVARL